MVESRNEERDLDRVVAQLETLKRLAILQLLASGVQATHIAKALNVHPSAISRMMPAREIKKLSSKNQQLP